MQLQSTTETTPCPAALHTLHHSAHPTRCRALFIAGHISCMGARATTSDQPIAPSPNEQNIKPPTLIPLQSFFFFIDDDAQTARVSHRLAVRPRLLSWPSPVVGASSLVDRAYQSAMTVSCVSSSPRGPTGCKASKPRGQPFVPFRKAMRRSPLWTASPHRRSHAASVAATLQPNADDAAATAATAQATSMKPRPTRTAGHAGAQWPHRSILGCLDAPDPHQALRGSPRMPHVESGESGSTMRVLCGSPQIRLTAVVAMEWHKGSDCGTTGLTMEGIPGFWCWVVLVFPALSVDIDARGRAHVKRGTKSSCRVEGGSRRINSRTWVRTMMRDGEKKRPQPPTPDELKTASRDS